MKGFLIFVLGAAFGGLSMLALISLGIIDGGTTQSGAWGQFPTSAKLELLPDGRTSMLLEDFAYIDPRGKTWVAPKGLIVDGASIPKVFWSIVGPYEGKYRSASIVHDEGCVSMREPSEKVHLMFYEACRCGGVPEYEAKVLYAAVYHFGPKWTVQPVMENRSGTKPNGEEITFRVNRTVSVQEESPEASEATVEKLKALIKSNNPSIDQLNTLNLDSL